MQKNRILVVDDDGPILLLMKNLLREFGFEPTTAASGTRALELARQTPFDLVLLDIHMPGMNGHEVIESLRSDGHRDLPVLLLSGAPVSPSEISALGASGAIQKPFDVPHLIEEIRNQLRPVSD